MKPRTIMWALFGFGWICNIIFFFTGEKEFTDKAIMLFTAALVVMAIKNKKQD
jgi:hypothetical protein